MNDVQNGDSHNHQSGSSRRGRGRRRRRSNRKNEERRAQPEAAPILQIPDDTHVVVGLTGEPAAGKSALAACFAELGAEVVDVDALGHEVLSGPATKQKVVDRFGEDILDDDGAIARDRLAAKAFADPESAAELNKLVRTPLVRKTKAALKKAGNFAVIDAARLHELGFDELCSQTVYVRAPREQRLARASQRGWEEDELTRRERALGDADERRRACQLTVDNSGDRGLLLDFARTIVARQLGVDPGSLRGDESDGGGDETDGDERADKGSDDQRDEADPVHADLDDYLLRDLPDLQDEGERLDVKDVRWMNKYDLICRILRRVAGGRQDDILVNGYIELPAKNNNGFLRSQLNKYLPVSTDTFIGNQQLRRFGLKRGMHVRAKARAPRGNERCPQLLTVLEVMGEPIEERSHIRPFQELTPLHATERLFLERTDQPQDFSLRIVDLVAPIGKGQRGLIVSQPKCGKTVYLQKVANAIARNNPECVLMILLIDERPEEVTDMERNVPEAEVIASTFDQHSSRHVQIAEMTINKARRLVEHGRDVVILLDSITRLARAYNSEAPSSGRIMSGGIESGALIRPKQFFGAARNIEDGGSLTILATALVDTGSVMDTVIFEEFKGTGNMELVLDRRLANKNIYPAVDAAQSGTRKDDLIIDDADELRRVKALRRFLAERSPQDAIEFLKGKLKNTKTNIEFLLSLDPERLTG